MRLGGAMAAEILGAIQLSSEGGRRRETDGNETRRNRERMG